ncbi:MAG TPA: helix-turn-helix domain-containing protein [Solirubrobacterales bacterium]|nr:helix-turn-helix domain-containing protein [Solirubrobacterales bacterium]
MTKTTSQAAAQQGATLHRALSDPSRLRILEVLQQTEEPLDARTLGTRVGLHTNTVRSHLRVLAEAGLVSTRREERTGPGRPRVLYQAAAEPPDERALTSYRLLAQILASSLGSEPDPSTRAEEAGQAWGAHLVRKPPPFTSISKQETLDEIVRLHEQHGFKAELRHASSGQELVLKRCPFQEVATTYQSVVCSVHLGLIRGALAELATGVEADRLEPFAEPGACVGHLTDG